MGTGKGPPSSETLCLQRIISHWFCQNSLGCGGLSPLLGVALEPKWGFHSFLPTPSPEEGSGASRWASNELELDFLLLLGSQLQCKNLFINFENICYWSVWKICRESKLKEKPSSCRWLHSNHITIGVTRPKMNHHLQILDFYLNLQFNAIIRENATMSRIYPYLESL